MPSGELTEDAQKAVELFERGANLKDEDEPCQCKRCKESKRFILEENDGGTVTIGEIDKTVTNCETVVVPLDGETKKDKSQLNPMTDNILIQLETIKNKVLDGSFEIDGFEYNKLAEDYISVELTFGVVDK